MSVSVSVSVSVYTCMCVCVFVSVCLFLCLSVCLCLCVHVCVSVSVCLSVCLFVCLSVYLCLCIIFHFIFVDERAGGLYDSDEEEEEEEENEDEEEEEEHSGSETEEDRPKKSKKKKDKDLVKICVYLSVLYILIHYHAGILSDYLWTDGRFVGRQVFIQQGGGYPREAKIQVQSVDKIIFNLITRGMDFNSRSEPSLFGTHPLYAV